MDCQLFTVREKTPAGYGLLLHHCDVSVGVLVQLDYKGMLMNREQLMEDIDSIIESYFYEVLKDSSSDNQDDLTKLICDAVCKHFPCPNNN